MTSPRFGRSGTGATVAVVVDVVVGDSTASGSVSSSAGAVELVLLATAIAVVPHASAAPVHAAIFAQRIGRSLLNITVIRLRNR
jgi:hypothetical protein